MYDDLIHFLAPKFEEQVKILELLEKEFDISFDNMELALESGTPVNDLIIERLKETGGLPSPHPGESQADYYRELLPQAQEATAEFLGCDPLEISPNMEFSWVIPYKKRRKFFNHLVSRVGSRPRYVGGSSFGCWTLFLLSFLAAFGAIAYLAWIDGPLIGIIPCFLVTFIFTAWIVDRLFTGYMYDFRFKTVDDFLADRAAEEAEIAMERQIARRALRVILPLCDPEMHEEILARMEERLNPPKHRETTGRCGSDGCGCGSETCTTDGNDAERKKNLPPAGSNVLADLYGFGAPALVDEDRRDTERR